MPVNLLERASIPTSCDHKEYCGVRTEQCDKCKRYIKIKDMDVHLVSGCAPVSAAPATRGGQTSSAGHALLSPEQMMVGTGGDSPLFACPYCSRDFGDFERLRAHTTAGCSARQIVGGCRRTRRAQRSWRHRHLCE